MQLLSPFKAYMQISDFVCSLLIADLIIEELSIEK